MTFPRLNEFISAELPDRISADRQRLDVRANIQQYLAGDELA